MIYRVAFYKENSDEQFVEDRSFETIEEARQFIKNQAESYQAKYLAAMIVEQLPYIQLKYAWSKLPGIFKMLERVRVHRRDQYVMTDRYHQPLKDYNEPQSE